jgi:hypothetical protein
MRDEVGRPLQREPVLPWKLRGQLWHKGWDIPTEYGVDATGVCWRNMAHGGDPIHPVDAEPWLAEMEKEGELDGANKLRAVLGIEPAEPMWMREARTHGWKPPES